MKAFCRRIVEARWFEPWMIGLIVFNGVLIGLETSHDISQAYGKWLMLGNDVILGVFIIEVLLSVLLGITSPTRLNGYVTVTATTDPGFLFGVHTVATVSGVIEALDRT